MDADLSLSFVIYFIPHALSRYDSVQYYFRVKVFWCTDTACTETEYSLPIATGKIYSRTLVSIKSTGILSDVQK